METRNVDVLHADGTVEHSTVEIEMNPVRKLLFSGLGWLGNEFSGRDLFEALIALRYTLEAKGAALLCAGARRDVFPSGMQRDMAGGRKAYVIRLGVHATVKNIVDIFDPADAAQVTSVSEQRAFFEEWLKSAKK